MKPSARHIEDVLGLRVFSTAVKSALQLHKSHAPFLGKIPGNVCVGTRLMRDGRTTVGVPCCSTEISTESGFCVHCEQLFLADKFDEEDFLDLDEDSMSEVFERHAPGKSDVL